jgi:hypothetical protein
VAHWPGESVCAFTAVVAAASAADDPATKNSLRVDFLKKDIKSPEHED